MDAVSESARLLHKKMTEAAPGKLFSQKELLETMKISNPVDLLNTAQDLVNSKLIKLIRQGDELMFQAISFTEANKISSMSDDEAMIYSYIEASGREGIWTKTIKAKTNLHQHIVVRCLKSLEGQRYIKSIKSVKHPTRKIYMLYNLQPSIDVTGGPWFTDSELDSEFIDSLLTVIWRYVASRTYPSAFQPVSANLNILQASFPYNHTGYADLNGIMEFIASSRITNIDLGTSDIRSLCDVLVYDDKMELINGTVDQYKVTWQSVLDSGFGKAYMEPSNSTPAIEKVLQRQTFSIFDHHCYNTIDEEEQDLVYFDGWIYS